jgi:hypothetical protein
MGPQLKGAVNATLPLGFVEGQQAPRDAVERMYTGQLNGVVFRQLCTPQECAGIVERLYGSGLPWTPYFHDPAGAKSLGVSLAPTERHPLGPPLDTYFADAEADAQVFLKLAAPAFERCEAAWSGVADGRQVLVLEQPRPHRRATLREMRAGYGAGLHVDTYRPSESFAHLYEHTCRTRQLSWYLVVQSAQAGGVLEVGPRNGVGNQHDPLTAVELSCGDGILFDGSTLWHRVTPVVGERARNTLGGFAALSADRRSLLYWG